MRQNEGPRAAGTGRSRSRAAPTVEPPAAALIVERIAAAPPASTACCGADCGATCRGACRGTACRAPSCRGAGWLATVRPPLRLCPLSWRAWAPAVPTATLSAATTTAEVNVSLRFICHLVCQPIFMVFNGALMDRRHYRLQPRCQTPIHGFTRNSSRRLTGSPETSPLEDDSTRQRDRNAPLFSGSLQLAWLVIPAYAGIQSSDWLDAGFRRHDEDIFASLHPMQGVNASELWD